MTNYDTLPFPEPDPDRVTELAAYLLKNEKVNSTIQEAFTDAELMLTFKSAVRAGFMRSSGNVRGEHIKFVIDSAMLSEHSAPLTPLLS